MVAFFSEEYMPWVSGICKCLGANARGVPRGQPPGKAADKCIAKSNRFTGSRIAVCSNRECEIVAIRVDLHCSSRIVSCKVESCTRWKCRARIHFCTADQQAQNFSRNSETLFYTFFSKKFSDQISLRPLLIVKPVSFFLQMCQQKGQVHPSAPNLKVSWQN